MIELSEFDIEYHSRGEIKGQAIIDFIAEYTYDPVAEPEVQDIQAEEVDQEGWVVHVDGSSASIAIEGGVVLITPEKDRLEYIIRFRFKATNNEAKYESMITGLRLTYELGVKKIKVMSNS